MFIVLKNNDYVSAFEKSDDEDDIVAIDKKIQSIACNTAFVKLSEKYMIVTFVYKISDSIASNWEINVLYPIFINNDRSSKRYEESDNDSDIDYLD